MDLIQIYQCFCEANRLRILHLLTQGPLCVCHFQDILRIPQAKVSQHLAYLRKHRMVETTRRGNWVIYRLPDRRPAELEKNLRCLQDCAREDKRFRDDLKRQRKITARCQWLESSACC